MITSISGAIFSRLSAQTAIVQLVRSRPELNARDFSVKMKLFGDASDSNAGESIQVLNAQAGQLCPQALARDFGPKSDLARGAIVAFGEEGPIGGSLGGSVPPPQQSAATESLARQFGLSPASVDMRIVWTAAIDYYLAVVQAVVARLAPASKGVGLDVGLAALAADRPRIHRVLERIDRQLADYTDTAPPAGQDYFAPLYQSLFPRRVRHAAGEYYTPAWLAEYVLDEAMYRGDPHCRVLDPACGSGAFLTAAIDRIRRQNERLERQQLCNVILSGVVGLDLNPLAVVSARANYLIALGELAPMVASAEIPVYRRDSILDPCPDQVAAAGPFDLVVGNPPWIAWDNLPADYRQATMPLWLRYGLFSLSANQARHGGAKKDLSTLLIYAVADRYLAEHGRLAIVVTQTIFQTRGAGDGFRRFRIGVDGPPLKVIRVSDLTERRPFDAANWTATLTLDKGTPTTYPVPYIRWTRHQGGKSVPRQYWAEPIDPSRPSSPWFLRPDRLSVDLASLAGTSDYRARLGANTGGASGVYWLQLVGREGELVRVRNITGRGKRSVEPVEEALESDLIYPLLSWGDIGRFRARSSAHVLLVQDVDSRQGIDEDTLGSAYPRTYAYLSRFRHSLVARAAYRRYQSRAPFYSMYNVGPYTVAPIKVVWRRMDRRVQAAVVEEVIDRWLGPRPVIPQETCVLIACSTADEAHYLCALLNCSIVSFLATAQSVRGGKGFGSPGMIESLRLKRYSSSHTVHCELARLSRQAHAAAADGADSTDVEERIDRAAAKLWNLGQSDLDIMRQEIATGSH